VHDNRNKKKNTDSSAEFHQNQLESICVFYLLASFCPVSLFYINKITQLEKRQISSSCPSPRPAIY
ncbi:hypothetical protein, partial [Streptococcus suis]|uniref:hypothetical protein n=3 Tax=Streptococcus TaxID=1301 RepID=UPI001EDEF84B